MTAITKRIVYTVALAAMFFLFSGLGCRVSYTLSGASIHPDARTVSIAYFPNNAPLVATILSPTFTDALQEKFQSQTRLSLINDGEADLEFEGEIVGYTSTPTAVTASNEFPAAMNRLTISVRVRFKNRLEPEYDFTKTFSHYVDYDSNQTLQSMEGELIPEVVKMLVDDIYMAAVSNW